MSNFKRVVNVIPLRRLNLGKSQIFTYVVPLQLQGQLRPGQIVKVPFGGGNAGIFGVVSSLEMHRLQPETKGLKSIIALHDAALWFTEKNLTLANWLSEYYLAPLGLIAKAMLPKSVKKAAEPAVMGYEQSNPDFLLTEHQRLAVSVVVAASDDKARVFLLHGPKGSGKTEVALQIMSRQLESGKQMIYLVPETESLAKAQELLIRRFGVGAVAVLHAGLRDSERLWQWHKIREGEKQIILGTRSAIFAPAKNLGGIFVDEEHHSSYKQYDQQPKYDTRTVAKKLAVLWGCPLVFASSTPSVNLYHEAKSGRAQILKLPDPIKADLHPPLVKLAPLGDRALSPALLSEITQALLRKQPALLVFSKHQSGRLGDELQALLLEEFRRDKPEVVRLTKNQILVDPAHKQTPLAVVGVLDADFYLNWQDFRAAERSYTHLNTLADKLGPGKQAGVLVLQTASPEHYVMQALKQHSYEKFFAEEISRRRAANDPPFSKLIKISTDKDGRREVYKVLKMPLVQTVNAAELLKDLPPGADIDVDPESLI